METLNVTKEVKNKIDNTRTSKLKTQNDIVEYLYKFYTENHLSVEVIDMFENGKILMWNSKYDVFGNLKFVVKYKNELHEIVLTKENKIEIIKFGKGLIPDYINKPNFPERINHDELLKEMESSDDKTTDGMGGVGTSYILKNDFLKNYLKNKMGID